MSGRRSEPNNGNRVLAIPLFLQHSVRFGTPWGESQGGRLLSSKITYTTCSRHYLSPQGQPETLGTPPTGLLPDRTRSRRSSSGCSHSRAETYPTVRLPPP